MGEDVSPLFEMGSLEELMEHLVVMKDSLVEEIAEEKTRSSEMLLIVINKLIHVLEKTEDLNNLPLAKQVEFMAYLHFFIEQTEGVDGDFDDDWDDGFDDDFDEELEDELSALEDSEEG